MSDEEKAEEEKKIGAISALPKITKAGYDSLEVRLFSLSFVSNPIPLRIEDTNELIATLFV